MIELKRAALSLFGAVDAPSGQAGATGLDSETLNKIKHDLSEISSAGTWEELLTLGHELADNAKWFRASFLVLTDVVETLVQDAEGRLGHGRRGELKLSEVKWVVAYLLTKERLQVPGVPTALQPFLIDVVTDVGVDALVAVLKDYDLLKGRPAKRSVRALGTLHWWLRVLWAPFSWLLDRLGPWLAKVYTAVRFHPPTSPVLRSALAALTADGALSQRGVLDDLAEFLRWLAEHKQVVTAFAQLVSIAVTQAEYFTSLDGPGKKQYAEEAVVDVLNDLGIGQGVVGSVLTRVAVDLAIDALVGIFNKRGHFKHKAHPERSGFGAVLPEAAVNA